MSLITNNNEIIQVASQPFSALVPAGWIQAQEYEQFLDYLAQQFNDFHENVNSILDFFDINKCPERFLKMLAFNLGMEIPLDEDLSPYARSLIKNAINIYKTKGTFDQTNTDIKGIGLWIKMATGYDITISRYPLLNPYMFVDQFNYRCAKLRQGSGSDDSVWEAIHPYEKEQDGSGRVMYLHEMNKYASEPSKVFTLFGVGNAYDRILYMFDYGTGEDIEGSNNAGISLPNEAEVYSDYFAYFYDNKLHVLFGKDFYASPVAKVGRFDFPLQYSKTEELQKAAWSYETISFPDGVTSIETNKSYQIFTFRNYVYFVGLINGTDIRLCRYNNLTRETELITLGKTLSSGTITAFTRTKFYFLLEESGITTLYVYDMILGELRSLAVIPDSVASLTRYSMVAHGTNLFIALQNNRILRYDIMYDNFVNFTLNIEGYKDPAYLLVHWDKICVQKFADWDESFDNQCGMFTVDVSSLLSAEEDSVVSMDATPHVYYVDIAGFSNLFSAFTTAGRVVYPSTLVISIESYGEFTTSRSLYARKMQAVKTHIDRYVQSGVLPIINDDN